MAYYFFINISYKMKRFLLLIAFLITWGFAYTQTVITTNDDNPMAPQKKWTFSDTAIFVSDINKKGKPINIVKINVFHKYSLIDDTVHLKVIDFLPEKGIYVYSLVYSYFLKEWMYVSKRGATSDPMKVYEIIVQPELKRPEP